MPPPPPVLLLLLSCLFPLLCSSSFPLIHDEMQALLDLRSALHHPSRLLDRTWHVLPLPTASPNYTASPCSWLGVTCSSPAIPSIAAVIALDLSSFNLSGTISPAIGRLRRLRFLSLAANNLSGELPPQLLLLPSLRHLNLSNNLLSGTFPPSSPSSSSSYLHTLDLYNNNLQGPLPAASLASLQRLRHLHLGGNYFNGSIPPLLASLPHLSYLALSGNSLTGRIPPQLGDLASLRQLYLGYYNQFDGGIPASFARLAQLQVLDMAHCGLSGAIPPDLFRNLTRLQSLFLFTNSLSGPLPPSLAYAASLRYLDLSNNRLSGPIPAELFRNLTQLRLLHLFRNDLSGGIPATIADLPSLQVVSLWQNRLTGDVPAHLGSNANDLMYVDFSSNMLTGGIPAEICGGGRKLEALILFNNALSGAIPESLRPADCPNLARIRLGNNSLSGEIPAALLALPSLLYLEIPANKLSGAIPSDIPATSELGRLDLSSNFLDGPIPPTVGNLSLLEALLLGGNRLGGGLPPEIGRLRRLSKLDLSNNKISGAIPPAISLCSSLTFLDLSRNQLDGAIPAELRRLSVLNFLNLSSNHLAGPIPDTLQNMQTLTSADFSDNDLSGAIPHGGQFAGFNATSFAGNSELCGAPLPIACAASVGTEGGAGDATAHLRRRRAPVEIVYWLIVAMMSALTVGVIAAALLCNRAAIRDYCSAGDGQTSGKPSTPKQAVTWGGGRAWKLTAFQKVDFTASHVVACLKEENVIGKGGSGTVYKCATPGGGWVAVKRLSGGGGEEEAEDAEGCFKAEIETVGRIRHRNIVRLVGWCSSSDGVGGGEGDTERKKKQKQQQLLVYEYMGNGSVGEALHGGGGGGAALDWGRRWRIALDAANGLRYLHHDCNPRIVHRDVKSNNILLDYKYEAHVADFGLARPLPPAGRSPAHMSSVAGSYGYIAPEYIYTLTVDEKSDIYSFGIVLLELLTGKRPVEPEFGDGVNIAGWARRKCQEEGGAGQLVDTRLEEEMESKGTEAAEQAELMLRVALLCTAERPERRPSMRQVVEMLSGQKRRREARAAKTDGQGVAAAETSVLLLGAGSTSASYSSSTGDLISI